MENKELLDKFEKKFEDVKKELGFKSSLNEIDQVFFVRDHILHEGFVSDKLSRQICSRISETLMNWNGYLHGLILPNPNNIINITEGQMFNEEEHNEIMKLISEMMSLVSLNTYVGISKDKKLEAEFIDGAVRFWKDTFKPHIVKIMGKIKEGWKEKAKEQ